MAIVKLGFGIQSIAGKVGGSVFSQTLAGLVLKNKTNKNQFKEKVRNNVKNYMAANNNSWSDLTDIQRTSWYSYANTVRIHQRRNSNLFISGRQLFIQYNQYRLLYELSPLLIPGFIEFSVKPVTFDMNLNLGNLILATSRVMEPANEFIVLATSMPVRPTLNNPGSRLRFLVFPTIASNVFDVSAAYSALFGLIPVSGQTIFFKAKNLHFTEPVGGFMETIKKVFI